MSELNLEDPLGEDMNRLLAVYDKSRIYSDAEVSLLTRVFKCGKYHLGSLWLSGKCQSIVQFSEIEAVRE